MTAGQGEGALIQRALRLLGKRRLVLSIHDGSYPSAPGQDLGRGSPYSRGAADFLRFCADLGFDGVLFGPQGQTSRVNPSPYDGTLFSRSVLSLDLFSLAEEGAPLAGLLPPQVPAGLARDLPEAAGRARYLYLYDAQRRALRAAFAAFQRDAAPARRQALRAFQASAGPWLERDALFAVLSAQNGDRRFEEWRSPGGDDLDQRLYQPRPGEEAAAAARLQALRRDHEEDLAAYAFGQLLLDDQHRALRARAARLGLRLYGDLQIGVSQPDRWAWGALFLRDYVMGAPPSRTNPAGQPWGYPVLDPTAYHGADGGPGPALRFLRARVGKMLAEFDGLRIDHPHGLVCPWVYDGAAPDALAAVQGGARLFSSPDLPDHPALARYAIARPAQLDRAVPRYDDRWVRELDGEQIARYSALLDEIIACAGEQGRRREDVLCEVLSTQPFPLRQAMARHGLGRFRVTQKASLEDPADGYRSENAAPEDWVMIGNHDTPPLWRLLPRWRERGQLGRRAAYLAERLAPTAMERPALTAALDDDEGLLAQAMLADLLASPAESVLVFFPDLLGMSEIYNEPGEVSDENWALRVPQEYAALYRARRRGRRALSLPVACALALRARGAAAGDEGRALLRDLEQASLRDPT